jgi:DNA processing protein
MELLPEEQKVWDVLAEGERAIDEIIERTGLSSAQTSVLLLNLEMKRLVRQLPGKVFARR